jgi:RNA polymerase sigma factor (sigma-70 family)
VTKTKTISPVGPSEEVVLTRDTMRYIFEKLYPRLVLFACRRTSDEDQACDLVMSMFGKVWEKKQGTAFENEAHVEAYLYRSLRNRLANNYRQESRNIKRLEEYTNSIDEEQVTWFGINVIDEVDIEIEKMLASVERLSPFYKKVIVLGLAGYTDREIADRMGTQLKNVQVNRFRAIVNLRKELMAGKRPAIIWLLLMAVCEMKAFSGHLPHIFFSPS